MEPDTDLLRRFIENGDTKAFGVIVQRHSAMVHGVAFRFTGEPFVAEEVTQTVFAILGRKAASLSHGNVGGWLRNAACFEAKAAAKKVVRYRTILSRYCHHMSALTAESAGLDEPWEDIRPHLDKALSRLRPQDRDIVVLHYFEKRSVRDIACATGKTEQASRKKLQRSIVSLRGLLQKRA